MRQMVAQLSQSRQISLIISPLALCGLVPPPAFVVSFISQRAGEAAALVLQALQADCNRSSYAAAAQLGQESRPTRVLSVSSQQHQGRRVP